MNWLEKLLNNNLEKNSEIIKTINNKIYENLKNNTLLQRLGIFEKEPIVTKAAVTSLIDSDRKKHISGLSDTNLAYLLTELSLIDENKSVQLEYIDRYPKMLEKVKADRAKAEEELFKYIPKHNLSKKANLSSTWAVRNIDGKDVIVRLFDPNVYETNDPSNLCKVLLTDIGILAPGINVKNVNNNEIEKDEEGYIVGFNTEASFDKCVECHFVKAGKKFVSPLDIKIIIKEKEEDTDFRGKEQKKDDLEAQIPAVYRVPEEEWTPNVKDFGEFVTPHKLSPKVVCQLKGLDLVKEAAVITRIFKGEPRKFEILPIYDIETGDIFRYEILDHDTGRKLFTIDNPEGTTLSIAQIDNLIYEKMIESPHVFAQLKSYTEDGSDRYRLEIKAYYKDPELFEIVQVPGGIGKITKELKYIDIKEPGWQPFKYYVIEYIEGPRKGLQDVFPETLIFKPEKREEVEKTEEVKKASIDKSAQRLQYVDDTGKVVEPREIGVMDDPVAAPEEVIHRDIKYKKQIVTE